MKTVAEAYYERHMNSVKKYQETHKEQIKEQRAKKYREMHPNPRPRGRPAKVKAEAVAEAEII